MMISLLTYLFMIVASNGQNLNVFGPERDDLANNIHVTHPSSLYLDGIDPKCERVHVYFDKISVPYLGTKEIEQRNRHKHDATNIGTKKVRVLQATNKPTNKPTNNPTKKPTKKPTKLTTKPSTKPTTLRPTRPPTMRRKPV